MDADETLGIVVAMIVGALHEHRLRIEITQPHIEAYRRVEITEQALGTGVIIKICHILQPYLYSSDKSLYLCRRGPRP